MAGKRGTKRASAVPRARRAPVLLVVGVGMAAATELRTLPLLERDFEVLVLRAGHPNGATPRMLIGRLADDAALLLDDAGVASAHVYGLSFGGMIAQELAIRHPQRVRALVLGATSAGGALRVAPDDGTRAFLRRRAEMPVDEGLWAAVPYSYALATRRRQAQRIGEDIAERLRHPVDPSHHHAQRLAAIEHDASQRLDAIAAPTLVIHGEEDRIVPPANGRALADGVPGARLHLVPGAAHVYPTDAPEVDAEVVRFLLEQSPNGARRRRPSNGREAPA